MMNCPNCRRPVEENATHCAVCGADVQAPPPAQKVPSAVPPRAAIAVVLGASGLVTEFAGVWFGVILAVGVGYFSCSMAFRLARGVLREIDDPGPVPGPPPPALARRIAFAGWTLGLTGMVLGIPLAFVAAYRLGVIALMRQ